MRRREFITGLGVAAAWPLEVFSEPVRSHIGFLHQGGLPTPPLIAAFRSGLREGGVSPDIEIDHRAADGDYSRLPALAADLVNRRVSVIAAELLPAGLAAKAATKTIPIVFLTGSDPIGAGLVSSIARPEGNVTGIAFLFTRLGQKNLELLRQLAPKHDVIGALANPNNPNAGPQLRDLEAASQTLQQQLLILNAKDIDEVDSTFAGLASRNVDALLVTADGFLISRRDQIISLAARYAVPIMYPLSEYVIAGGLMSYGASLREGFHQTGIYVAKILTGATPSDLPILQSTKFELMINQRTAKSLGITVPPGLLAIADEVIE
jgi:putative tryptophan/tyrosine transport system substrate-binding protein